MKNLKALLSLALLLIANLSYSQNAKTGDFLNIMYIVNNNNWVSLPGKIDEVKGSTINFTDVLTKEKYTITYAPLPEDAFAVIGNHIGKMIVTGKSKIPKNAELITAIFRADLSKSFEGANTKSLFETIKDEWGYYSGYVLAEFPDGMQAPMFIQHTDEGINMMIISVEKVFELDPSTFVLTKSYLPKYKKGDKVKFYKMVML